MPITWSPFFFHWRCNHNDTEIKTSLASDKFKWPIWSVTWSVTWSACPELAKTESRLTQGDNEWGDVEVKRTFLSSGGNKATQLVKKLKWCQINRGLSKLPHNSLARKVIKLKIDGGKPLCWMDPHLVKKGMFNMVEANLLWPYYLYYLYLEPLFPKWCCERCDHLSRVGVQPGRPWAGAVEQSPPQEGGSRREGGVGQGRTTSAMATS